MKFAILGPLEVRADNTELIPLVPHAAALVAVLLVRGGAPCSSDWLHDALWGGDLSPVTADAHTLTKSISRLRRTLRPSGLDGRVEAVRGYQIRAGYRIRVEPGELDLATWRTLFAQGQDALSERNAAGAARLLDQALALWREPPLRDLPETPPIEVERDRLLSERRDARDALVDARLALGQHAAVLSELRATVRDEPLNEHACGQLMLALYRRGLQAEALRAHSRLRQELARELGAGPGPEVEDLLTRILDGDRSLAAPAAPAAVTAATAAPPTWIPVRQLPAAPPDFTGREAEAAALAARLAGQATAVTVITGLAGAGKTALALHGAHQARPQFGDGQIFADLGGLSSPRDPQDVLAEMLRALGVPPAGIPAAAAERSALYRSLLAGRNVLVVLDNASSAAQVRPLLPGTAGSAVIVTSRSRLSDLDAAGRIEAGSLAPAEAVALLGKITGPGRAGSSTEALAAVAGQCEYLPLAIRAAGARLAARPQLGAAAFARSLADSRLVLGELAIGDLSVRASISASYEALDGRARRAWRLLALHGPALVPGWLPPVLAGEPGGAGLADQLAAAGMLLEVTTAAGPRYRMPGLWRAYATGRLEAEDQVLPRAVLRSLYAGWLGLADAASRLLPRPPHLPAPPALPGTAAAGYAPGTPAEAEAWFRTERPNLLAVTRRALDDGRTDVAADLASRQMAYQWLQGRQADAERLWLPVIWAAGQDRVTAARARYQLAAMDVAKGRLPAAMRRLRDCMDTFESFGDVAGLADAQCLAAEAAAADWDLPAALGYADKGVRTARQTGDARLASLSLAVYGTILAIGGRGSEGVSCCEEAVAIAGTVDDAGQAFAAEALKQARYRVGRPASAEGPAQRLFPGGLTQTNRVDPALGPHVDGGAAAAVAWLAATARTLPRERRCAQVRSRRRHLRACVAPVPAARPCRPASRPVS